MRARILDAAQAEFTEAGYAGASTNRILARFGGSKPTMFRHYPTKRDMFLAVVTRIAQRWSALIDLELIPETEPSRWLRTFGGMVIRWILSEDNLLVGRWAIAEGNAFPELAVIYRDLAVQPIETLLTQRLAEWSHSGLLDCQDPHRDAVAFLDLMLAGTVSRALLRVDELRNEAELDDHVAYSVQLFLDGRNRPRQS